MSSPPQKLSKRKKAIFGLVTAALLLVLLEVVLGLAGVKPLYLTQDPFVGFQPGVPLFVRDGDVMRTNPSKRCFFNDQTFPADKAANAYRVFCLGGSTTFGHPYDYRTSFSNWLRERLEDAAPDRAWEIVNCGGISYASYRECLLMQELVQYKPDLFVILTGHNEFLEERTYGDVRDRNWLITPLSSLVVRTRTGSLMASLLRPGPSRSRDETKLLGAEVDTILEHSVGPSAYHRDEKMQEQVVAHFRWSLDRMCAIARAAGARVVLVQPPVNLRGFSPFKSEHGDIGFGGEVAWSDAMRKARKANAEGRLDEAVESYLAAEKIDPHDARGLWEAAGAMFAAGRYDDARRYFTRAVDEDVCPLRATSAIQAEIEDAARENRVPLIDFPRILEASMPGPAEQRIPGNETFLDHVHPTIEGHRLLAWALFDQLAAWNVVAPQPSDSALVERVSRKTLKGIDARAEALALVQVVQVLIWAGKNEEALRLADKAEQTCSGLSEVLDYRGRIMERMGRDDEAMRCYMEALKRNPDDSLALSRAGFAALKLGNLEMARTYLATAILRTPPSAPLTFRTNLRMGLGVTFAKLQQWREATLEFQAVLRLAPENAEARQYLDRAEAELAQGTPALPKLQERANDKSK